MSTRKFAVGDRVRVIGSMHGSPHLGKIATLLEFRPADSAIPEDGWWTDLPTTRGNISGRALFNQRHLEKIDYDGNQAASWSECAWQPRTLKV